VTSTAILQTVADLIIATVWVGVGFVVIDEVRSAVSRRKVRKRSAR